MELREMSLPDLADEFFDCNLPPDDRRAMPKVKRSVKAVGRELVAALPWPFAGPGPLGPNLPTPAGAALGRDLACLADLECQLTGRDARCEDCAFRLDTVPNQCLGTVVTALKCVAEGVAFDCHKTPKLCGGYAAAMKRRGSVTASCSMQGDFDKGGGR